MVGRPVAHVECAGARGVDGDGLPRPIALRLCLLRDAAGRGEENERGDGQWLPSAEGEMRHYDAPCSDRSAEIMGRTSDRPGPPGCARIPALPPLVAPAPNASIAVRVLNAVRVVIVLIAAPSHMIRNLLRPLALTLALAACAKTS